MGRDPRDVVSSNLPRYRRLRLPSVRFIFCFKVVAPLISRSPAKFQQYMYGGRPLDVRFNDRWHTFTPTAAKGGQVMPMQPDM